MTEKYTLSNKIRTHSWWNPEVFIQSFLKNNQHASREEISLTYDLHLVIKAVLFEQDEGGENSGKRIGRSLFSFPFNQLKLTYKQNIPTERVANIFHGDANS